MKGEDGIDPTRKEEYLGDAEFEKVGWVCVWWW